MRLQRLRPKLSYREDRMSMQVLLDMPDLSGHRGGEIPGFQIESEFSVTRWT